jgi:coatomer protein complex subunit alpha (xenin)
VLFHPKHELIVSNSEDRTIRVWDIAKRLGVQTFRRESDRFWILAAHPEQNLLAAGHDSGMTVFKLERERLAFDAQGARCFYVKDRYLRLHEFSSGRDIPLVSLRRTSSNTTPGIGGGPRHLSYNSLNKAENNVLIVSDAEGGTYELITFGNEANGTGDAQDVRRGSGLSAVFLARDRFAVLDKSRQLLIKNFQNEVIKKVNPPLVGVDGLFFAGISGRVILKSEDKILLFDQQAKKVISELQVPRVKYVVWNNDYSLVALISKHQVVLANKQFEQLTTINETVRVKGGCWDGSRPIFVYTTLNHVKYVLPSGDRGIIRGLDSPIYVTKVHGNSLYCLDREGKTRTVEIDATEALFKLALEKKDYSEVLRMVKHSRLCGQAIITYLQEKGYPEVALHFVQDNKTRFKLALACGNIQIAMNVAYELGDDAWRQLGIEALRQGNHEVVEMSYQKTKEFERLSFLYLITGNTDKLKKMLKIAEMRNDVMSRFHNSLFLGDVEERVRVLEATGQISLAYLAAATYGLLEESARLQELLEASGAPIPSVNPSATLLQPPTPILRGDNWPLLAVTKSSLSDLSRVQAVGTVAAVKDSDEFEDAVPGDQWGDDDLFDDDGDDPKDRKVSTIEGSATAGGAGWEEDDLNLSDDEGPSTGTKVVSGGKVVTDGGDYFVVPQGGQSPLVTWCSDSSHAVDHFAAGSVESALQLLNRQIALVNAAPLKSLAISSLLGSTGYLPGIPLAPVSKSFLTRESGKAGKSLPAVPLKSAGLLELLKQAYKSFTSGQFPECRLSLDTIIQTIPVVLANSRTDTNDLKELLDVCREYITALRVKTAAGETEDPVRSLELSAYFTHCSLQPAHLLLALKTAMANAFKSKVYLYSLY